MTVGLFIYFSARRDWRKWWIEYFTPLWWCWARSEECIVSRDGASPSWDQPVVSPHHPIKLLLRATMNPTCWQAAKKKERGKKWMGEMHHHATSCRFSVCTYIEKGGAWMNEMSGKKPEFTKYSCSWIPLLQLQSVTEIIHIINGGGEMKAL